MINHQPTEELIINFDRRVSYGLWQSILQKTVEEADRLGFDLSKEDGGLEDPLSALHQLNLAICRARLEYLSPFGKGSDHRKCLKDAMLDGYADRLREDVLSAWRTTLGEAQPQEKPVSQGEIAPAPPQSNTLIWSFLSVLVAFLLLALIAIHKVEPYHNAYSQLVQWWQRK
ncbi:MAG: hypothetical protein JOY85_25485 [Acidobacteriaceae bacterium]|nr:hypothetical protein [Acidobacteriaceae bacterium]